MKAQITKIKKRNLDFLPFSEEIELRSLSVNHSVLSSRRLHTPKPCQSIDFVVSTIIKMASKGQEEPKRTTVQTQDLTKALTALTAAVKAMNGSVGELSRAVKKDIAELKGLRENDVRLLTSRVSSINTSVSYMRQNVCETLATNVSFFI